MENSFRSIIGPAKSILVMLPTTPNFDQVASGTAIYQVLANTAEQGKEVNIYSPSEMVVEFNRLVGVNKIKTELGNKNLAISFKDYNPQGIEKVSWDIDKGEFKLTVVPKMGIPAPSQDQVQVSYAGVAADLVILIGGKAEESFPALKSEDLANVNVVHIGINGIQIPGRTISSLAGSAPTISELTANIIKSAGFEIMADVATNLLMGIEASTDGFTAPIVTADTFILIGELMKAGGKRLGEGRVNAQDFPAGAIPGSMPNTGTGAPPSWLEPKIFKGTSVN